MQISPTGANLSTQYNFNTTGKKGIRLPFMSDAVVFNTPKIKHNFSSVKSKSEQIAPYHPDLKTYFSLITLDDDDFTTILDELQSEKDREQNLLDGVSTFSLRKEKLELDNIYEGSQVLCFSDMEGHFQHKKTRAKAKDAALETKRTRKDYKKRQFQEFVDTSVFNPDYQVRNRYREASLIDNSLHKAQARTIIIKRTGGKPVLNYSYGKTLSPNSSSVIYNLNGKKYISKINHDGKAVVRSGNRGSRLDFSTRLDFSEENSPYISKERAEAAKRRTEAKKEVFVQALKMLPPQILCEMEDDFDTIQNDSRKTIDNRTLYVNLFYPEIAAETMIEGTVEAAVMKNRLLEDTKLQETYKREKENFESWLQAPRENVLMLPLEHYLKDDKDGLMNTIKAVSKILWMEEYPEGRANDEEARLLLNFFPETTAYIVTKFDMNNIKNNERKER